MRNRHKENLRIAGALTISVILFVTARDRLPTAFNQRGTSMETINTVHRITVMFSIVVPLAIVQTFALPMAAQEKSASLGGRVTDANGLALVSEVRAYQEITEEGFRTLKIACSAITNTDGIFSCAGLPSGRYIVQILPATSKAVKAPTPDQIVPSSFYFPHTTNVDSAEHITLHVNQSEWVSAVAPFASVTSVTGLISDRPAGAMLNLSSVSDTLQIDTGIHFRYDPANGRFIGKNVPYGHYVLTAKWISANLPQQAEVSFDVGEVPIEHLSLEATPTVVIFGQLEGFDDDDLHLRLQSLEGRTRDSVTTAKKGTFQFQPVPVGRYVISVDSPHTVYVDRVTMGGKETDGAVVTFTSGAKANLKLTIASPTQNADGSVESCRAPTGCEVIAVEASSGEVRTTKTDRTGKFHIEGLRPGDYRFYASIDDGAIAYRDTKDFQKFEKDSTELHIQANGFNEALRLHPIDNK